MFTIGLYAILAFAAIGLGVGWTKSKAGATWGQPLSIACAIIAIGTGLWLAYANSFGNAGNKAGAEREIEFQKVQTRKLGAYLKEKFSGKTAILVKDPGVADDSPSITGLKEGLDGAITFDIVAPEAPKPKNPVPAGAEGGPGPDMMEPIEQWFTPSALEKILKGKKADIVIFTTDIPRGVRLAGKEFSQACLKGKKVVLAGGNIGIHGNAIKNGAVVAAVTYKTNLPESVYEEKSVPKDLDEAFNKRFLLVTPENIATVAKENQGLFGN